MYPQLSTLPARRACDSRATANGTGGQSRYRAVSTGHALIAIYLLGRDHREVVDSGQSALRAPEKRGITFDRRRSSSKLRSI